MHVGDSGVYPCKPQTIASYVTAQTPTYNILQRCVSLYTHPQSQVDMKPLICSTADTSKAWSQSLCILKETNIASPFNTFHHIRGQDNCTPSMHVITYKCMCVFRASRRRAGYSPPTRTLVPPFQKCPQSIT